MISLNAHGEDALATVSAANPGQTVPYAGWLSDDVLILQHPNGSGWRLHRDGQFRVEHATPLITGHPFVAMRAGGWSWVGQQQLQDDWVVTGELGRSHAPFPAEHGQRVLIADVARDTGAVLTTQIDPDHTTYLRVTWLDSDGFSRSTARQIANLARPPRLSPCGRAVSWITADDPTIVCVWFPFIPTAGAYILPGAATLTPKLFAVEHDVLGQWWVLSHSRDAGLTFTPLDNPHAGHQWAPTAFPLTDFDVILTDQTRVCWEQQAPHDRVLTWSDGFVPGLEPQIIQLTQTVPPAPVEHVSRAVPDVAPGPEPALEPEPPLSADANDGTTVRTPAPLAAPPAAESAEAVARLDTLARGVASLLSMQDTVMSELAHLRRLAAVPASPQPRQYRIRLWLFSITFTVERRA